MKRILILLVLLAPVAIQAQAPGYFPPPSMIDYHGDSLTIYPPDSLPGEPVILLGYNIYVDSVFYDNVQVSNQPDTIGYVFDISTLLPGTRLFCARSVYNSWISEPTCDTGRVIYGYELPFLEDWESGDFETNQWTVDSDHWTIDQDNGSPLPAARFSGSPAMQNYSKVLESYAFRADSFSVGKIFLKFDIKLESVNSTGTEELYIQVYNWNNGTWLTVADFGNRYGSFGWDNEMINIGIFKGKIFKVRFLATGAYSSDITSWELDNINVYRTCDNPTDLEVLEYWTYNKLYWTGPVGCWGDWLSWDDWENYDAIGTGGSVYFDVAARWEPGQISYYDGLRINKIAFFPNEELATYNVRIWKGMAAAELVLDLPVENPVIGEWNIISIEDTIYLDGTQELWVGYHVNTLTGYPAGCDDGPAVNGYGNMMNYQGEWQTLLQINPELNYNWNIHVQVGPEGPDAYFNIYRETDLGGFEYLASSTDWTYTDDNIVLSDYYCYQVTMTWMQNGDTCESQPTNTACEVILLPVEENSQGGKLKIYPNPADEILTIVSDETILEIDAYNVFGQKTGDYGPGRSYFQLPVAALPDGIYFVEITTPSGLFTRKIVIDHN